MDGPSWPLLIACCPPRQKREAFCQLLQLMKNKHSKQDEPDMISVFIGTWNMGQSRAGLRRGRVVAGVLGVGAIPISPLLLPCRQCATSKERDVLVHLKGSGKDPG